MVFDLVSIEQLVANTIWPMMRLVGLFLTAPIFSNTMVPIRIKLIMILTITVIIAPFAKVAEPIPVLSILAVATLIQEFLIGMLMGYILLIIFQSVVIAGQTIAMQSGLGFATLIDPSSGSSVPLVGQLFVLMISLIFFALNGHLLVIQLLADSFKIIPISPTSFTSISFANLFLFTGSMFAKGISIALPVIIALLITNLAFGVMSRAAPQMHIFSIGFPVALNTVMILLYFLVTGSESQFIALFADLDNLIFNILGGNQ